MELRNQTDLVFTDISSERRRIYHFDSNKSIQIYNPLWLNVSDSGGHRILDNQGNCHYIPSGWIHLEWNVNEGQPHFVK